jgi:folate-binding protein YgfZ
LHLNKQSSLFIYHPLNPYKLVMQSLKHPSLKQLPANFMAALPQLGAIRVTGPDTDKYLQGQLTCDLYALEPHKVLNGGHCDAKGKLFSIFRLVSHGQGKLLIQQNASLQASLAALKKFGVFSQVEIDKADELDFYLLCGEQAANHIKDYLAAVPDALNQVIHHKHYSALYISGEHPRYLVWGERTLMQDFASNAKLEQISEQAWQLLEMNDGIPLLSEPAVGEYVPQMLNLQAIDGISFTKGCYLGQETVARMQYLGNNKRALFTLTADKVTTTDDIHTVEVELNGNWRRAGMVLATYISDEHQLTIQAVLASDSEKQQSFRIKEQPQIQLTLNDLPYQITQAD